MKEQFSNLVTALIVVLVLSVVIISCKSDPKAKKVVVENQSLVGEWELLEAKKSGKVTRLLDNAFFRFDLDRNFTTNLTGKENTNSYTLSGDEIQIATEEMPNLFNVLKVTADTLTLSTRIATFDFELVTLRRY